MLSIIAWGADVDDHVQAGLTICPECHRESRTAARCSNCGHAFGSPQWVWRARELQRDPRLSARQIGLELSTTRRVSDDGTSGESRQSIAPAGDRPVNRVRRFLVGTLGAAVVGNALSGVLQPITDAARQALWGDDDWISDDLSETLAQNFGNKPGLRGLIAQHQDSVRPGAARFVRLCTLRLAMISAEYDDLDIAEQLTGHLRTQMSGPAEGICRRLLAACYTLADRPQEACAVLFDGQLPALSAAIAPVYEQYLPTAFSSTTLADAEAAIAGLGEFRFEVAGRQLAEELLGAGSLHDLVDRAEREPVERYRRLALKALLYVAYAELLAPRQLDAETAHRLVLRLIRSFSIVDPSNSLFNLTPLQALLFRTGRLKEAMELSETARALFAGGPSALDPSGAMAKVGAAYGRGDQEYLRFLSTRATILVEDALVKGALDDAPATELRRIREMLGGSTSGYRSAQLDQCVNGARRNISAMLGEPSPGEAQEWVLATARWSAGHQLFALQHRPGRYRLQFPDDASAIV